MNPGRKTRSGGPRPGAGRPPKSHRIDLGELGRMMAAWPGAVAIPAEINGLAAIVVKMTAADADSAHRPGVTVGFQSQAGLYPYGAAIRLLISIYDQQEPLQFDAFLNVAGEYDLALLRKLASQTVLDLHIFDETMEYRYTKRIPFRDQARAELAGLVALALDHTATIAAPDFPRARDQMMAENPL